MSIYAISDLHLSFGADKPMDIFKGWDNYEEKIKANWTRLVTNDDTVIIPGDVSWALKLEDTLADFKFIDSLPGKKIILKGNHDLWWSTMNKLNIFFAENKIETIKAVFNNAIVVEEKAICGTRGWDYASSSESEQKVRNREAGRLETSIKFALETGKEPLVFLHFPPVYADFVCEELMGIIKKYGIKTVYHGHIHGAGCHNAVSEYDGVKFKLLSCDCVDFTPVYIC